MKTLATLALALSFVFTTVHPLAAAQFGREQRNQVCVYEHNQYNGWEQCYSPGDEVTNLRDHGDGIASFRVFGRVSITVYENGGFGGNSATFSSDVSGLVLRNMSGSKSWNDRIDSLRINSGLDNSRPGQPGPEVSGGRGIPQARQNGVCVYDRVNYQGRMECWQPGDEGSDLARLSNWNDRISSIQVFGNLSVVAYQNAQFNGERIVIGRNIPDLNQLRMSRTSTWNDQISALQIECGPGNRRGRGWGLGRRGEENNPNGRVSGNGR